MANSVSVIIPTLNEEKHIAHLLDKLVEIPSIEIIVSDGYSTDGTLEICRRYPIVVLQETAGRGKQLNAGALSAKGDILLFLHADTIPQESIFADLAALDKEKTWGCCTMTFDAKSPLLKMISKASHLRASIFSSCYGDQGIFCSRDLFFKVDKFPEIPIMEDLSLSSSLRKTTGKAYVLPGQVITSSRRFKKNGVIKTILNMQMVKLLFYLGFSAEKLYNLYHNKKQVGL